LFVCLLDQLEFGFIDKPDCSKHHTSVAAMHFHGLLYWLTLQSKNVFLDGSKQLGCVGGEVPYIKLGDFGIAKILEHTGEFAHTQVGAVWKRQNLSRAQLA
jgi:hypothetical protein